MVLHEAPSGPLPSPEPEHDHSTRTIHHTNASTSMKAATSTPQQLASLGARSWGKFTQGLHQGISAFVLALSLTAARNPRATIGFVVLLSLSLMGSGYLTNFHVELSESELFASYDSPVREHRAFVDSVRGFPSTTSRQFLVLIHREGGNVLTYDGVNTVFQTLDTMRNMTGYDDFCGPQGCEVTGVTRWWNSNTTAFQQETKGSNETTRQIMSNETWPDGTLIRHEFLMGYVEEDEEGILASAESFFMIIGLPLWGKNNQPPGDFELQLIDVMSDLQNDLKGQPDNPYRVEFVALRSYSDELMRAIAQDFPLIPFVFLIMSIFTCAVFWRKDSIQSRSMLGVGSVFTIAMSLMSGFGLAFLIGIPFTSMTQMLPFVIFGVGLDDTFIITGAYFRTDPRKDTIERVEETMAEVGNSIALTTITTTSAFCLGCISTIPSIRWLCIYAFPTIFIDFLFQITLFIAILVLDESRIQSRRRDCFICFVVEADEDDTLSLQQEPNRPRLKTEESYSASSAIPQQQSTPPSSPTAATRSESSSLEVERKASLPDRFMAWYADRLLQPKVKAFVIFMFTAFCAGCIYSASLLEQRFETQMFMPDGSYAVSFLTASQTYRQSTVRLPVYFRHADQTDDAVQEQMVSFLEDMVALPQFGIEPEVCWVNDLTKLKNGDFDDKDIVAKYKDYVWILHDENLTFMEKFNFLLGFEAISSLYSPDIALDKDGNFETTRCWLTVGNLDLNEVDEQIQILKDMRQVMKNHPANKGHKEENFFIYDGLFFIWEFFYLAVDELIFTTISGVVAVSVIGFFLIPHWSAVFFVAPLLMVLYIDLLGVVQFGGLYINPITYVCLVISIGLLVDFLMHFLLRFYESTEVSREQKVKDALRTMGSSILVGGMSTLLGVFPLAFSTSAIMRSVFVSFLAMICLGIAHGLILLPVLLSYVGPEVCIKTSYRAQEAQKSKAEEVEWEEPPAIRPVPSGSTIDVDAYVGSGPFSSPVMLSTSRSLDVDNFGERATSSGQGSVGTTNTGTISNYDSFEEDATTSVKSKTPGNSRIAPSALHTPEKDLAARKPPTDNDTGPFGLLRTTSSGSIEV